MKKSLALIGIEKDIHKGLIRGLMDHCQLILVSESEDEVFDEITYDLQNNGVPVQSCAREGCWEADIIFMLNKVAGDLNLLNAIKEVSTQKVVVGFSETMSEFSHAEGLLVLKQLLPHSKVLWGYIDDVNEQVFIKGGDQEALREIQGVVMAMDYRLVYVENSTERNALIKK